MEVQLDGNGDLTPAQCRDAVTELMEQMSADRIWLSQLLVSELATNAVVHGGGIAGFTLTLDQKCLVIRVTDRNPEPSRIRDQPDPLVEAGRGMILVDRLASWWGVEQTETGKTVWCELRFT